MKKLRNRKTFRFLFKLVMLFLLYSHLKSTTEATQLSVMKNVSQCEQNDGNNLNDRMSQIEAKSQRQENEISFLKVTAVEDRRIIRQLRGRVSSLESLMLTRNSETNEKLLLLRPKRPYRLLPVHQVGGGVRDKMEKDEAEDERFYGPASNCDELGKLGYTLNGYYLVKGKDESLGNNIEAVLCRFKLPKESKGGTNEKRLGLVTIGENVEKSQKRGKQNQIESVSNQLKTTNKELMATARSPLGFISNIHTTTTANPFKIHVGNNVKYENLPSPPRMANLINGHGKGFNVYWDQPGPGWNLIQWDTRGSIAQGNKWSWNETSLGSGDRHLCNGFGKCATSRKTNVLANNGTLKSDQMGWVQLKQWDYSDEEGQRFYFLHSLTYPGFYVIKDEFGKCIGVPENTDRNGAEIWTCFCNSSDVGQRWEWHYLDDKIKGTNLINGLGKCLNSGNSPGHHDINKGIGLYQWDCDKSFHTMLWSWNQSTLESRDRHICDGSGFCVAAQGNVDSNHHLLAFHHKRESGQRFTFADSLTHPGFYVIKNDYGKCLSVEGNTHRTGAEIWANHCNPLEAGQRWKWL